MTALLLPAAAVLGIGLAVYGVGSRLAPRPAAHGASLALERWTWGLAAWTLTLFALACLDLFRPAVLVGLTVLSAALGAIAILRDRDLDRGRTGAITTWLVPGALAAPLGLVFAVTVNPTISWDAAVYHLSLPDLYLREGGFRVIPLLVYGVWPQAVDMMYGVALAVESYVAAKALHFGFGVLTVALLLRHGAPDRGVAGVANDRAFDTVRSLPGLVAAALFLLNGVVLFELRAAYVDLALGFFALAAFLLLERWLDHGETRHLVAAGVACGLLASAKINGIVPAACLATLILPRVLRRLRSGGAGRLRTSLFFGLTFGLPLAVLWLPWLARTWITTGNPVYPLFWGVFGGPDWSEQLGSQFLAWQRSIGMGREFSDYLLLPWRVFTAGEPGYANFDGHLTPLWLVLLPLALWRAFRSSRARRSLAVSGLIFVTWAAGSQQMRFLIPALPLLALAVADGVAGLLSIPSVRRFLRSQGRAQALVAVATLAWLAAFGFTQGHLVEAGWSHLKLYGDSRFERPSDPPGPPVFREVSALPQGSVVLLLNSNHLFHCRPTTCWADSFYEAPQISHWLSGATSAEEVALRLAGRGVTHVAWSGRPIVRYPQPFLDLLYRPDLATPIFAQGPERLWQLAVP